MIPITLITGFLGSGKTTLLRRIAHNDSRRLAFLVNEFSAADVDGRALQGEVGRLIALPGGSIFCACLVTEFITALRSLHERFHTADAPLEGVVIEASGIANPKAFGRMLRETQLDAIYAISAIIAIVDPLTFPVLLQTLPNIAAQVECSDWVLLNKTDLADADAIAQTETELRRIAPQARIIHTVYCAADLDLFDAHPGNALDGVCASGPDSHFAKVWVRVNEAVDLERLLSALRALPGLYRAKGFLRAGGVLVHVDATAQHVSVTPCEQEGPADLVIITHSAEGDTARSLGARIKSGEFCPR